MGPLTGEEGQLPPQYKLYQDVLCEKDADWLSPTPRPYDYKIDLLRTSQLYSVSETELVTLK